MTSFRPTLIALAAGAALVISGEPSLAHGLASGGIAGGLTHPLTGLDHLSMLVAVGLCASVVSSRLLLWALGGAAIGAAVGLSGWSLPAAELLAALAVCLVAGLSLWAARGGRPASQTALATISRGAVAAGVALHALLHGLEAPRDGNTLLWWSGALLSSALVCVSTTLLANRLPAPARKSAAVALLAIGGLLALGSLLLPFGAAAA